MSLETVGWVGAIVFAVAGVLYSMWFHKLPEKVTERIVGNKLWLFKYSAQIFSCTVFSLLVLSYMHALILMETGFFLKANGVVFFWARFAVYPISFALTTFAVSKFVWMNRFDRLLLSLLTVISWIIVGVAGSFTLPDDNWINFGLSFVPFGFVFFYLFYRRRRLDNIACGIVLSYAVIWGGSMLIWALSPLGSDVIDMEESWWAYFAIDVIRTLVFPYFLLFMYLPMQDAIVVGQKGLSHVHNTSHKHRAVLTINQNIKRTPNGVYYEQ